MRSSTRFTTRRLRTITAIASLFALFAGQAVLAEAPNFAGTWNSTFGPLLLVQEDDTVDGVYVVDEQLCSLSGTVKDGEFTFDYQEGETTGEGAFKLADGGTSFTGKWHTQGSNEWHEWNGERVADGGRPKVKFAGVWASTFGRMRLVDEGGRVHGLYALAGGSTIEGREDKGRLKFKYKEGDLPGEGWFVMSADGGLLHGHWKAEGSDEWSTWSARRVEPKKGIRWLVVIEARWEESLDEGEYAFGSMLKAFFAREPKVQVRHRFFNDASDLKRWCREIAFLPEPVVLCIATHGTSAGLEVAGESIGAADIAAGLAYASNIELLHFSACSVMKEELGNEIRSHLKRTRPFPISGYTKDVDWAASAVVEFLYYDLVLARGLKPTEAAKQLLKLTALAAEDDVPESSVSSVGFRFLPGDE